MTTIHLHETTTATPEQLLAALVDFGPGRSKIFQNSADDFLKVHERGADWADVTEGSAGTWERLHYDWSDPMRVTMKTTDSNTWGGDWATRTPSRGRATGRRLSTPWWYATGRTSRATSSRA